MNPGLKTGGWRSIAIIALAVYLTAAGCLALVQLIRGMSPHISWMGLAIAAIVPLVGLWWDRGDRLRRARPPLVFTLLSGLGLAITMALSWRYGPAAGWIHVWAGLSLIGWVAYIRWLRTT